jgi:predicted NUDIX family NTP pyrophosphohydrolase
MAKMSAGILLFRRKLEVQVFLVHPGGPFWSKKDEGVWSIPKGEIEEGEELLKVALREFSEETGQKISGDFIPLEQVKQRSGKIVFAWAVEGDADENNINSNTFEIEWPPKSGKMASFPEVDKAAWFSIDVARKKINPGQATLLDQLLRITQT